MSGSQHSSLIDSLENSPMDPGYHNEKNYDPIIIDQLRYEKSHPTETDQSASSFLEDFKNKSRFADDFVTQFSPVEEEPSTNATSVNAAAGKTGSGFLVEDFDYGGGGGAGEMQNGYEHQKKQHVYTTSATISSGSSGDGFPGGRIHLPTGENVPAGHVTSSADFDPEEFTYTRSGPLLVGNPVILKPEPDSLSEIKQQHQPPQKDEFDWSALKSNQPVATTQASAPPANNIMQDFDPIFADLANKKQQQQQSDQKTGSVPAGTVIGTGSGSVTGSTTGSKQWAATEAPSTDNFFSLKRLNPKLLDLIYWRDWRKSALFFVPIFALLLCLALFSFISVFAYAGLILIAVSLSLRLYTIVSSYFGGKRPVPANANVQTGGEGDAVVAAKNPLEPYLKTSLHVNEAEVQKQVEGALKQWNRSVEKFRSLLLSENLFDTAKLAAVLWILTYVGACISFTALIVIAFVALFTLPKFYEVYKEPIDRYYALGESKAKHVSKLINEKTSQFVNKKKAHGE